jgi:uncharacterized cysteine cluster protein YcgN (CxxCxxCC family)
MAERAGRSQSWSSLCDCGGPCIADAAVDDVDRDALEVVAVRDATSVRRGARENDTERRTGEKETDSLRKSSEPVHTLTSTPE